MTDFVDLMTKPFLACIILTGIHAYLGLHVIERQVIFVDLALAQIAALGATSAFLCGYALHSSQSYFFSLGCTLCGAALFALTRLRKPVVPQEALIGIAYAIAAAATIMLLSRTAEGGEELKALLVGHLLFVDWPEIAKIAVIYSCIGLLHWRYRHTLLTISCTPKAAFDDRVRVRWWDFFFYGTFGVVVTSSVEMAGVLLVFSFLIVPAVCGALTASSIRGRLWIGWLTGALTSTGGIALSYQFDFPTGATVVCTFAIPLLLCSLISSWKGHTVTATGP